MEARQTMQGSGVLKALPIVLALCAAAFLALGVTLITMGSSGSGSTVTTSAHPAPGTVLRQDWEVKASPAARSAAPNRHHPLSDAPGFTE